MSDRMERFRQRLEDLGLDAGLVTAPLNLRYLTGFTGDLGMFLVSPTSIELIVDSRYTEQAKLEAGTTAVSEMTGDWATVLRDRLVLFGSVVVGVEEDYVTVGQYRAWQGKLPEAVELRPVPELVSALRQTKGSTEIEAISRAISLTDEVMSAFREWLKPGLTELEGAWFIESYLRTHGAEAVAFDLIVAGGPNGAMAHARPSHRPLQEREPIVVDIGARVAGYNSDMTRTLWMGEPDERFESLFGTVLQAQEKAEAAVGPEVAGKDVDAMARDIIAQAGYGQAFGHGLGHGVGLAVHEGPRLSPRSADILVPGNVVSVEPGIYLPGWGGIRIEDLVLVEASGARVLTRSSKQPWVPT